MQATNGSDTRARATLDRSRRLLSALAEGFELDQLAGLVVSSTGIGCNILTAVGRPVCAVGRELADGEVYEVLRTARDTRHFPVAAAGRTVLPVGRVRDPARAWYLIVDASPAELSVDDLDAFYEFASVAALVHARDSEAATLRDRADDLTLADRPADASGVVLAVACDDPHRLRPLVRDCLTIAVGDTTVAAERADVLALVPAHAVRAAVSALQQHLGFAVDLLDSPPTIGYAAFDAEGSFDGAIRGACRAARSGGGPLSATSADSLRTATSLFAYVPDEVRRDYVRRVLGPVIDHDSTTGSRLLETLSAFLEHGCSWVRTAEAMHMHQNTVRYRMTRTEALLGRSLSAIDDRLDVRLALELR